MKLISRLLFAGILCLSTVHAERTTLYTIAGNHRVKVKPEIARLYSTYYKIVEIQRSKYITPAKVTWHPEARLVFDENYHFIRGSGVVAFIITEKGEVIHPCVLSTTDLRLKDSVLEGIKKWHFKPARMEKTPIPIIITMPFSYEYRQSWIRLWRGIDWDGQ
ncbi:MAG: energy transducer TonB [Chthoniobacteraceae bacterium]